MQNRGSGYKKSLIQVVAAIVLAFPMSSLADDAESDKTIDSRINPATQINETLPTVFTPDRVQLVSRQLRLVEELELEYGPFDIKLKEAFKGLGFQLRQSGELEAASEAYKRALHVSRINEGLYNESQLSIVERLIDVDQKLARWDRVNDHYGYLEHLYKKIYGKEDPRLERGLRKVVAWHLDASSYNLNGERIEHLHKAHGLLKLRLEVAELTRSGEDPLLDALRRNIAQSEHILYLASDQYREMSRERRRYTRDRYLVTLD